MVLIALQKLAASVAICGLVGGIGGLIIGGPAGAVTGAIGGAVFGAGGTVTIRFYVS